MERPILSSLSSESQAALKKYSVTSKESNKYLQLGLPHLPRDRKRHLLSLLELLLLGLLLQSLLLQGLHLRELLLPELPLRKLRPPEMFINIRRFETDQNQLYKTRMPRLLRSRLLTEVIR
jgi:hypothetical protein